MKPEPGIREHEPHRGQRRPSAARHGRNRCRAQGFAEERSNVEVHDWTLRADVLAPVDGARRHPRWDSGAQHAPNARNSRPGAGVIRVFGGRRRAGFGGALVQIVQVTDDAESAIDQLCDRVPTLTPDDVVEAPYALIGTAEAIAAKLERCRSRWGISYFVVRDHQQFELVMVELR